MNEEQKKALKRLVDSWTQDKSREDAINEVRMAFLAGDALEHIAMLEMWRDEVLRRKAEYDKLFGGMDVSDVTHGYINCVDGIIQAAEKKK